jgi:predicted exporter
MRSPTSAKWRRSLPWLVLALLTSLVLATRLELSFDLSAFFPRQTTLAHDVLLEQLQNGPGSRLIVIGISGASRQELAEVSGQLRQELALNPDFAMVQNGEFPDVDESVPEPIDRYYPLLEDIDYGRASIDKALESRLRDLSFGGGTSLLQLIARDPFLVTIDIVDRLAPVDMSGEVWIAGNGSAVLMAATRAPAIDLVAQTAAVNAVKAAFAGLPAASSLHLEITGVGAFGVELQDTIRAEAQRLSILATAALCLVLLLIYRKPGILILATMPIGMGFLLGLTVVSLAFDSVHGITLAFGFTLMGVAVDYPLHLFSHARLGGPAAITGIWPTMKLGALSTAAAYIALAMSGSEGLAQLGVFTAVGVGTAAIVTRYWLPLLIPADATEPAATPTVVREPSLNYVPAIALLLLALFSLRVTGSSGLWDDRLSSLSPVPEQRLQTDMALRSAAGTPDMRYQLVRHESSLQSLLMDSEAAELRLRDAADDGLLTGWRSVSQLLPSRKLQRKRQAAIPDEPELARRLQEAVSETPFRAEAFAPFLAAAATARALPPLEPAHLQGTLLQPWLDSHLLRLRGQWVALTSVIEPSPKALAERARTWGSNVELVDLQLSSVELMQSYRSGAITTVSLAAFAIAVLIWVQRRRPGQIVWIALTVTTSLAATIAIASAFHQQLTVIHLVALLLVLGLGLDYALFLSRPESVAERGCTNQAVLACAMSTTLAFGVLATSSIPVLKFLGLTVATGSVSSYLLALAGSRSAIKRASSPVA